MRSNKYVDFKHKFNRGDITPRVFSLTNVNSLKSLKAFESSEEVLIIAKNNVSQMIFDLQKLFERYHPYNNSSNIQIYNRSFIKYLKTLGIVINNVGSSTTKSLERILEHHGSIGYFPIGISDDGKCVYEKIRYFSHKIENIISESSAWKLLSNKSKKSLSNSTLVAIGLSVGSELVSLAVKFGIQKLVLTDPGTLHPDLVGRLGEVFDRSKMGLNKARVMEHQLLRLNPYLNIEVFEEGLNKSNMTKIIHSKLLSSKMKLNGGLLYVLEESDTWDAKQIVRKVVHKLPKNYPWHLFMLGDVGHRVTLCHETQDELPFLGFVAKANPKNQIYGDELAKDHPMSALFASVGGFSGIPTELLQLLANSEIGMSKSSKITRVPQSREATLLAAAIFAASLRTISGGGNIKSYSVVDLDEHLDKDWDKKSANRGREIELQKKLNTAMFKVSELQ